MTRDAPGILLSELRHVVSGLRPRVGHHIQGARVPTPHAVALDVRGHSFLYVEVWPYPRLHPQVRAPANPPRPYSFQGLLRARFRGAITRIDLMEDDRIVEIGTTSHTLHLRLMGRGGGIWLLEGDRVIGASDGPAPDALPPLPEGHPTDTPPRFSPQGEEGWPEAAARWLGRHAAAIEREREIIQLRQELRRHVQRATRKVRHLEGDLSRAGRSERLRYEADALSALVHRLPKGTRDVEIPDPEHPDQTLTLRLDPARSPVEEMTRRYATARRLDAARAQIKDRLAEAREAREAMVRDLDQLETPDTAHLRRLRSRYGLDRNRTPTSRPPSQRRWQTWTGPHGQRVLLGRNAAANHALTFGAARGRDWWLHLRDRPGAHAVIPMDHRGDAPPLSLLLVASELLLAAARVPEGATADVQYARVSDLAPVRGQPGKVVVRHEKVLHVRRDPDVLQGWEAQGA